MATDGLVVQYNVQPGDLLDTLPGGPWEPIGDLHSPGWCKNLMARYYVDISGSTVPRFIPRLSAPLNLLLRRCPRLAAHANCAIRGHEIVATKPLSAKTPLVLQVCPGEVLGRVIPRIVSAGSAVFDCPDYLQGRTPSDSEAGTNVSLIDGYITMDSMARLASMWQHCGASAVIGSGYGEIAALLHMARSSPVLAFETVALRRSDAHRLFTYLEISDFIEAHGTLSQFLGPWSVEPTLIWSNNINYIKSTASKIPMDLLGAQHFPATDSVLVAMESFNGAEDLFVCFCGNCKNGRYTAQSDSVFRAVSTTCTTCGLRPAFCAPGRLISLALHSDVPADVPVTLEPYGKGRGVRPAVCYTLHACVEDTPTPNADLHLTSELIESAADYTPKLREMLSFASDWLEGDLLETSMIFHGSVDPDNPRDGAEELGIDCAIAFIVKEKDSPLEAYAYRTVGRVRDCRVSGLIRISHDVVHPDHQNKGRISLANTQLARVIEWRFPDAVGIVIEPDRIVDYHRGYEKGFPWTMKTMLRPQMMQDVVSAKAYRLYREQIAVDEDRYKSMYFAIPRGEKRAHEDSGGSAVEEEPYGPHGSQESPDMWDGSVGEERSPEL
jgi:hypothetical protein